MPSRSLPVPDGLAGERVDAALAKLLGLSRTFAAEVAEGGGVRVDDRPARQSRPADRWRLARGGLGGSQPDRRSCRSRSRASAIVFDDDDIVVVDKPAGVAAHPSVGWEGPTVLGALAAAGYHDRDVRGRGASGDRPPAGRRHERADGGREVGTRLHRAQAAPSTIARSSKIYHALVQGHPDPLAGTIDAPIGRHPGSSWKFAVVADGKASVTHYETLEAFPFRVAAGGRAGDRPHASDQGAHGGAAASVRRGRDVRSRPGPGSAARPHQAVAARRRGSAFRIRGPASRWSSSRDYPADLQHALEMLRRDRGREVSSEVRVEAPWPRTTPSSTSTCTPTTPCSTVRRRVAR